MVIMIHTMCVCVLLNKGLRGVDRSNYLLVEVRVVAVAGAATVFGLRVEGQTRLWRW